MSIDYEEEVLFRTRRIRSERLREHQFKEGYAGSLEGEGVEWDGENNDEHIWKQMK